MKEFIIVFTNTVFMLFGFFFTRIAGNLSVDKLQRYHIKNKTAFAEKDGVFKAFKLFFKYFSFAIIILILLYWFKYFTS
ncbi:hypothetical protein MHN29_07225 [Tenacibaculum sp. Cn5-46]|nr:hypothetical protein [Tenacibaculum sp. Cn5-46]